MIQALVTFRYSNIHSKNSLSNYSQPALFMIQEVISRSEKLCDFSHFREAHSHSHEPDGWSLWPKK
jgi:hypothetical protein